MSCATNINRQTCRGCDVTFARPIIDNLHPDYCERCNEELTVWPSEERIDRIGQSGPTGGHYSATDKKSLSVRSKYHREIKPSVFVDVYDVLQAWGVSNPALQHLIKKALQPGGRGHKDLMTDLDDIIASAQRAKELES